ncbi:MAG TPA: TAXI family TRAP transporter solute-binding subunit, partial [Motiliproteus sp.]
MPDQQSKREHWLFYGGGAVIVILGFVFAYQFVKPAPPDHIRIATGSPGNAYHLFATRYAKALAADGITLEILATGGSIDNLLLLKQKKADIAFVQAGIANPAEYPDLRTLGSLYFEPLWVFVHQDHQTDRLNQLKGLTLSIGSEGSGTRFISEQLLAANGINTTNTTLKSLNTTTGLDALKRGEVDALFVVSGPQSPLVLDLLTTKNIVPLSFERANAYARRYDYLSSLVLPEGSIDLASNIPNRPIELVAPAATLVASTDFHPALTTLVLQAAKKEHSAQTLFAERG